jgi:hypothetical protein
MAADVPLPANRHRERTVAPPTHDEVMAALATVIDPELGADIVSLGMVPSVDITAAGRGHRGRQAHDSGLSAAGRDQEGSREQGLRASRRDRREDLVG